MSFNSRSPERPGNTSSHPFRLRNCRARSTTATASGPSGTRCSFPAFMRSPESVQVRLSTSISDQRAPRASPLRAAVRIRNRRQRRTAARDRDPSTVASSSRTSACGRARWLFARRRRFGRAPSIASPATFRLTNSPSLPQLSTVRICWRTRRAVVGFRFHRSFWKSTRSTSSPRIASTRIAPSAGKTYRSSVLSQARAYPSPRQFARRSASVRFAASENVGTAPRRRSAMGSLPSHGARSRTPGRGGKGTWIRSAIR